MSLTVDTLTRVGPGTPAGAFFREFWLPVAKASEVEADGPPVRLLALGEKLIAFRDTSGRVGVMDHRCPHRCASLFFGRNEENGIRCAYHGWKFDVDGNCLDMPNVPLEQNFASRVKAKAYPARERNGVIWVYMGPRKTPPALPSIGIVDDQDRDMIVDAVARDCNWLQAYEGDIDPSHLGFLHHGNHDINAVKGDFVGEWIIGGPAAKSKVTDTGWGTMEAHVRPGSNAPHYWHYSQHLFPSWSMPGQDQMEVEHPIVRFWLPMDDEHSLNFQFIQTSGMVGNQTAFFDKALAKLPGVRKRTRDFMVPNTTDWLGRWNISPALENDFFVDRDVQRNESFTGIEGVQIQDKAITESMGSIVDRSFEHLSPADLMIARVRKRLLDCIERHQAIGDVPDVIDDPSIYKGAYAGGAHGSGPEQDWLDLYRQSIAKLGLPEPVLL
jgi:phthalate 4,5-dioxygenase oxygenase subunit